MRIVKYDVWSLDVWGNEEEGFTVNDRSCFSRAVEFPTYPQGYNRGTDREFWEHWPSDKQIVQTLIDIGFLKDGITVHDVSIGGENEFSLYIEDSANGFPLCQLEYIGQY